MLPVRRHRKRPAPQDSVSAADKSSMLDGKSQLAHGTSMPHDEPLPKMVLHVLNSATGGTDADRRALAAAVEGRLMITPLYWTNHKIRSAPWKRPIHELRQLLQTGFQRASTAKVVRLAQQCGAELIHTNTIVTSEGGLAAHRLGLPHVWHVRELVGKGSPCPLWLDGPPPPRLPPSRGTAPPTRGAARAAPPTASTMCAPILNPVFPMKRRGIDAVKWLFRF